MKWVLWISAFALTLGCLSLCSLTTVACLPVGEGGATGDTPSEGGTTTVEGGSTTTGTGFTLAQLQTLCNKIITQCGQTLSESQCEAEYASFRVSQTCVSAILAATCDDLAQGAQNPSYETTCFPLCGTPNTNTCSSDNTSVSTCNQDGHLIVFDCAQTCAAASQTFTGSCGGSCVGLDQQPTCCCQ